MPRKSAKSPFYSQAHAVMKTLKKFCNYTERKKKLHETLWLATTDELKIFDIKISTQIFNIIKKTAQSTKWNYKKQRGCSNGSWEEVVWKAGGY